MTYRLARAMTSADEVVSVAGISGARGQGSGINKAYGRRSVDLPVTSRDNHRPGGFVRNEFLEKRVGPAAVEDDGPLGPGVERLEAGLDLGDHPAGDHPVADELPALGPGEPGEEGGWIGHV